MNLYDYGIKDIDTKIDDYSQNEYDRIKKGFQQGNIRQQYKIDDYMFAVPQNQITTPNYAYNNLGYGISAVRKDDGIGIYKYGESPVKDFYANPTSNVLGVVENMNPISEYIMDDMEIDDEF